MRAIQKTLLPEQTPHHPSFDIVVSMKTASTVGGDYYDFHLSGNDTLTFVIADATGHGAKAGLMVTAAKILFLLFGTRKNYSVNISICHQIRSSNKWKKRLKITSVVPPWPTTLP